MKAPELQTVTDDTRINWAIKDHFHDRCKTWKQIGMPTLEKIYPPIRPCVVGWQYIWFVTFTVFLVSYLVSVATGVEIISAFLEEISKVPRLLLDALLEMEIVVISTRSLLELGQSCIENVVWRRLAGVISMAWSVYNVIVYCMTTCRDGIFVATEYILSGVTSPAYFTIYCLTTCKDYIVLLAQYMISGFVSVAYCIKYFVTTVYNLFVAFSPMFG